MNDLTLTDIFKKEERFSDLKRPAVGKEVEFSPNDGRFYFGDRLVFGCTCTVIENTENLTRVKSELSDEDDLVTPSFLTKPAKLKKCYEYLKDSAIVKGSKE